MASITAKKVAHDVLENVRKGKKVEIGKILLKNGYSKAVSKCPTKVTKTKSYQEVMEPMVKKIDKEIHRIGEAMMGKDLSEERYDTLYKAQESQIKLKQLLSGQATENVKVMVMPKELIDKNSNDQEEL